MRLDLKTPTLADTLSQAGFATGAFIAAYPLDRRFGLIKGFQTYGDRMPPSRNGRAINERPGREVVDEALAWLAGHRARTVLPLGPSVRAARAIRQPCRSTRSRPRRGTTARSRRRTCRRAASVDALGPLGVRR